MGKSGNPAKRASKASDFKNRRSTTLELPSGLRMFVRNPGGLRMFMAGGMIPNSLMPLVQKAVDKGRKVDMEDVVKDGQVDDQLVEDMMSLMDTIVVKVAVEPEVHPVPENEDERDDELLYADEIEEMDKMFIFQWVTGGTRDLAQFRKEYTSSVASVSGGSEVVGDPESSGGTEER